MRMWMVDPAVLCSQHLLGEHVELHMLVGTLNAGKSIAGYVRNGLVDVDQIKPRHEAIAKEMRRRGMDHRSPLPQVRRQPLDVWRGKGKVDRVVALKELAKRCPACRQKQKEKAR